MISATVNAAAKLSAMDKLISESELTTSFQWRRPWPLSLVVLTDKVPILEPKGLVLGHNFGLEPHVLGPLLGLQFQVLGPVLGLEHRVPVKITIHCIILVVCVLFWNCQWSDRNVINISQLHRRTSFPWSKLFLRSYSTMEAGRQLTMKPRRSVFVEFPRL